VLRAAGLVLISRAWCNPQQSDFLKRGEITTKYSSRAAAFAVCMLAIGAASTPAGAFNCDQTSTLVRPIELGVSGGNIDSFGGSGRRRFCFSGTLGSMVQDSSNNQYILSNNHVLADINKAKAGQMIVQPGLVDTGPPCTKITTDEVATFSRTVKLKFGGGTNTVDAAIALITPGEVNSDILNIGPIASSVVDTPTVGLAVQKMGRSTCVTEASISQVSAHGKINYGSGRIAKFVNQIVITGSGFSSAGDSGSLVITQDACPQAVGLLFAGSADGSTTIANPISAVLSGFNVTMVGGCTAAAASNAATPDVLAGNVGMSKDAVASAASVRDRHEDELMRIPGAVGTGIGASDQPGQPAIVVYVKKMTPEAQAAAPKEMEGVPVKLIANGGFIAY
jgi:hypothetical protein